MTTPTIMGGPCIEASYLDVFEVGGELIFARTLAAKQFIERKTKTGQPFTEHDMTYLRGQYFEAKYAELKPNPLEVYKRWFE